MSSGLCDRHLKNLSKFVHRSCSNKRKSSKKRKYKQRLRKKLRISYSSKVASVSRIKSSSSHPSQTFYGEMETLLESASKESGSWFWENYNNAMDWQSRHFAAYLKARCSALEAENNYLHKCLNTLRERNATTAQTTLETEGGLMAEVVTLKDGDDHAGQIMHEQVDAEEQKEEFVFEINDDMLAFLETSAKHKLELKKQREEEKKEEEAAEKESKGEHQMQLPQQTMQERRDDMANIYGPAFSMILSMETAMQLSFDRFSDKHQPKTWPNIPLKF